MQWVTFEWCDRAEFIAFLPSANASVFLAILNQKLQFKEFRKQNGLSNVTQNSAQNLENEITHLHHKCTEVTEYFQVSWFSKPFSLPAISIE